MPENFPYNLGEAQEEASEMQKIAGEKPTKESYDISEEKAESSLHAIKYVDSISANKERVLTEAQKEKLNEIIDYFSNDEWPIYGYLYLYTKEPIIPKDILKNAIMEGMSRWILKKVGGHYPSGHRIENISLMYFFNKNRYESIKKHNLENGIETEPLLISYSDLLEYQLKRSNVELTTKDHIEKDLSNEQIDNIMQKVQDINKYGTAVTNLVGPDDKNKYGEIQQEGPSFMLRKVLGELLEGSYRTDINRKRETVFFHINGRINEDMVGPLNRNRYDSKIVRDIETDILGTTKRWFRGISILLDISKLQENHPLDPTKQTIQQGTFSPDIRGVGIYSDYSGVDWAALKDDISLGKHEFDDFIAKNPKGDILATGEYGFITNNVKSDDYKGIILGIKPLEKINWSEFGKDDFNKMINYYERLEGIFERGIRNLITVIKHEFCERDSKGQLDHDEMVKIIKTFDIYLNHQLQRVINIEKDKLKNNPELLLPIYDIDGNLLWPKKMSYEEVKDLVKERDDGKEQKEL